jgi:hypothetical protein
MALGRRRVLIKHKLFYSFNNQKISLLSKATPRNERLKPLLHAIAQQSLCGVAQKYKN